MKTENTALPWLGAWQKKQAAMLYHYSSVEYLHNIYEMVTSVINNIVDPAIDLATTQNRDTHLKNKRWGTRDTVQNWSNNAWPLLKDLQISLAQDVAARRRQEFSITSVMDKFRGIAEYSTAWATPHEKARFERELEKISDYAIPHDKTCREYHNAWNDASFTSYYLEFSVTHSTIPKLRLRNDVTAFTGEIPHVTGVYIAHDDPHATLQFAWAEGRGAVLRPANTFNTLGLEALKEVGRDHLWINDQKMFKFAMADKYANMFRAQLTFANSEWPSAAAGAVSLKSFKSVPCKWSLVGIVRGELEIINSFNDSVSPTKSGDLRVEGGSECSVPGFYFTPSVVNSRRLVSDGALLPDFDASFVQVLWQRDANQKKI